jgi:hypothetical protein
MVGMEDTMETLASKLLILGILSALGGTGLIAPSVSAELSQAAASVVASDETSTPEAEESKGAGKRRGHGRRDAALENREANEHRERAHGRRDAIRELNGAARTAREAAREGGMSEAERAAMRELSRARRSAIHAMNESNENRRASDEASESDDSASDHGRRGGPSRRMAHGR